MSQTSEGTLLGGKIRYQQFLSGHRSGFEPVLLAASVAAEPSQFVLEAGTGAGAALLCLGQRVPDLTGIGMEILPEMVNLANENFKNNGLEKLLCIAADAVSPPFGPVFDHIMANPPWHDVSGTTSPDGNRALAHHAPADLLADWVAGLTLALKPRGSLTLILPAALFSSAAACLRGHKYGDVRLLPLASRIGQGAKQVIIAAKNGGKGPDKILPALVLHDESGISPAAQKILRDGAPLSL